jgi:hypothetical protein
LCRLIALKGLYAQHDGTFDYYLKQISELSDPDRSPDVDEQSKQWAKLIRRKRDCMIAMDLELRRRRGAMVRDTRGSSSVVPGVAADWAVGERVVERARDKWITCAAAAIDEYVNDGVPEAEVLKQQDHNVKLMRERLVKLYPGRRWITRKKKSTP